MNAVEVLGELRKRGVRVERRPAGKLRLAPAKAVGPALLEKVRELKAELLLLVSDRALGAERLKGDGPSSRLALDHADKGSAIRTWEPEAAQIHPAIAAELDRIEAEALRLGWTRDRLWNAHFWRPWPRGLASVLEAGDQITEITSDFITIRKCDGRRTTQRFWKSH
jgi:hypothetical protein